MSDFATRFNGINFAVNGVNGFQNKVEIKKEITRSLLNDGKIDDNEKKSLLSKVSVTQRESLASVLSSLEQEINVSVTNGKINPANVRSTQKFISNLLHNNDNVLFIGMNTKGGGTASENGGVTESNSIRTASRLKGATPVKVTVIKDETSASAANVYKGFDLKLPEGRASFLNSINIDPNSSKGKALDSVLNEAITTANNMKTPEDDSADELAGLIENWSKDETSSRLVISGHNYSTFDNTDLGNTGVFGDSNGQLKMDWVAKVAEQFPEAANKIEDLAFSACNSGWENDMAKYQKIFPNLGTVMAYTNTASSTVYAKDQLANWTRLTQGESGDLARSDLAETKDKGTITSRSTNITTWSAEGGYDTKNLNEIPKSDRPTRLEFIKEVTASLNLKNSQGQKLIFDYKGSDEHSPKLRKNGTVVSALRDITIDSNSYRVGRLGNFVKDKAKVDVFISEMLKMPEIPNDIKKQIIESFIAKPPTGQGFKPEELPISADTIKLLRNN